MLEAWPFERLPGFGFGFELDWTHLYCARNGAWFLDNFIHAFMIVQADKYHTLLPSLHTPSTKKGNRVPPSTLSLLTGTTEDLFFLPLNINNNHWTCILVDRSSQTLYCYDSFDKRSNQNLLAKVAEELKRKSLLESFQIVAVHSPIQKDSDNCGLFICLFVWRRFFKEAGSDNTATGLQRRRWDLLRTIVSFSDTSKAKETATPYGHDDGTASAAAIQTAEGVVAFVLEQKSRLAVELLQTCANEVREQFDSGGCVRGSFLSSFDGQSLLDYPIKFSFLLDTKTDPDA
ncbi:hypothetical protein PHYPSEUDO_008018 [Phytophthora pseudosyringae]|uniref:Ubiquitin-like protease family profile domain-containing protein n=1 Tax=Phytophthora pseudosyringae TaxID=221518 RepID=A0A8T1VIE8_9STRA|nr:hypothetical protein PHYPSEUDO_008018 [Phytophthora pseudosyringae]